jgi:tRNA A37 methylthiotransferase MiaB
MAELLAFQDELSLKLNMKYENSTQRVLVDAKDEKTDIFSGRTLTNKLVYFSAKHDCIGEFVNVKITKACPYHLLGEIEK